MAQKVSNIVFFALLITLPLGELARFSFQNNVAITALDVIVFLFVTNFLSRMNLNEEVFKDSVFRPLIIFLFIVFVSLIINSTKLSLQEFFVAFLYLIRFAMYAGIYFVVKSSPQSFKKNVPIFLLFSGFATVLIGFVQYFFYPSLRNLFYAGWDEHLYRMFSSFLDPNFAGVFFVLIFLLGIRLFFREKKNRSLQYMYLSISLLTVIAIFLTYSRTAIIALAFGLGTVFFLGKKTKLIFIVISLLIISVLFLPKSFQTEGTNLLRTASNFARVESMQKALKIFVDNPFLGVGFNAYRYAQKRYGYIKESQFEDHAGAGTDNSFLFVLATTGIIGFVSYLYLWKVIIQEAWQKQKSHVILATIISLFISSLFLNTLFYPFILAWFWILFAVKDYT